MTVLREIPLAVPYARQLEKALLDAEEAYLNADNDVGKSNYDEKQK